MSFEWKVALRFLRDGGGQTVFILLGIAIGVAVQVFIGTLIAGLQQDLIGATVGNSSHITFRAGTVGQSERSDWEGAQTRLEGNQLTEDETIGNWQQLMEELDRQPDLRAVSPLAQGNGFLVRSTQRNPVLIRGVIAERADGIYSLRENLVEGELQLEGNRVLLGSELARDAGLQTGDSLTIELPGGGRQSFTVGGIFDLGNRSVNETWIFMDLNRASRLLGLSGEISRVETQVTDVFEADRLAAGYQLAYNGIRVDNWKEENADLLVALQSQSSSTLTIQVFVLLAITLGIASVLAVSVVQKSRQLGILKAMGVRGKTASRIFLLQGGILGFAGALCGVLFGYLLTEAFLWGTAIGTGQPIFALQFQPGQAVAIVIIATLASVFSAYFPARRSARLDPIDVIRG